MSHENFQLNSGGVGYLTFNSGVTSSNVIVNNGTGVSYQYTQETRMENGVAKRIGPKLYFNYVKSKLNKTQTKKLKTRLQKLQVLVKNADELGQKALYEEFSKMLVVAVRESEAVACGYDVFVNKSDIDKFIHIVTENDKSTSNPVKFKNLESFPRAIPSNIKKIIKSVQTKGLFDELWVLYLDYTGENLKSNKEKIREKDPIVFGKFNYDEKYYFIADWIDEYCDLTLSKFVDELKTNVQGYEVNKVEDVTPEYLERIKQEIRDREERLLNTNVANYRDKIAEEDKAEIKRLKEENEKRLTELSDIRKKYREEAAEEFRQLIEEKDKELKSRPWYKKIFKLI